MTNTRPRTLTALAGALLLAFPLTACGDHSTEAPTSTTTSPATTAAESTDGPPTNIPDMRVDDVVEAFFTAADDAAAKGWQDLTNNDVFLSPDLAEVATSDDETAAGSGARITGERELTELTIIGETDTDAVVEFCSDTSSMRVVRAGSEDETVESLNVGRFTLARGSAHEPWLITEMGFSPEDTTCEEHFTD